jgi:iron complex outermembrane recepter protein
LKKFILSALLSAVAATAFGQSARSGGNDKDSAELQEVVVTGTLIRGIGPIGQPATTIDNATIVATGTTNTADLLATQPALNSFNTLPIGGNQEFRSTGATVPGMRGLPGTAVLVMLDGHRLVGDSPLLTTADPSSIPAGAIDHIEIVQDGGSATYGSDAVAGVINIILKKNFDGAETSVSRTNANGYTASSLGQTFGKTWSGGSGLLSFSYENNSQLLNSDRSYYTQDLRPYGGRDGLNASCGGPLNVLLGTGVYYNSSTLARQPVTPIAPLSAANPAQAKYIPPVTQGVSCDPAYNDQLINPNRRFAVVGNLRHDLNDKVHLFADAKWTDDFSRQLYNPTNLVVNNGGLNTTPGTLQQTGTLIIPGTNPFFLAPAGYTVTPNSVEQVFANSSIFGAAGNVVNDYRAKSGMLDFGATVDLSRTWQLSTDFDIGYSRSIALDRDSSGPNPNALYAAEFGTTTATALDPFGGRTNPSVIAGIMNWPLLFTAIQRIYDYNVKADGSLFSLPGGDVKLAVGGAYRKELYSGEDPIGIPGPLFTQPNAQSADRRVKAIFGEIAIPIIGASNAMRGIQRLELSIAGRHDDYSDFGGTSNPKYSVVWTPMEGLSFRGSYGTSFHAPQLADVFAIDTRATAGTTSGSTIGPTNFPVGNGLATIGFAGGKQGLKPETAKTASFGVDFKPTALPGLKGSLTYFLIRYSNEVVIPPNNVAAINNPALAGQVYTFNQTSTTGCDSKGNPVAAGTGGPCYAPIPQAKLAALLAGVRAINFTGTPPTYLVTDLRRTNLGSTAIDGWDFDISYQHDLGVGTMLLDVSGEYLFKFQTQAAPGVAFTDNLTSGLQYFQNDAGAQSIIPWHVRVSAGWQAGPWSTQAAMSYTGHYNYLYTPFNYATNPNGAGQPNAIQWVAPFVTVDLSAMYDFPSAAGFGKGLRAQFNVYNTLNANPPLQFVTGASAGFASESASPLGRTFRLSLNKRW